MLGGCLTPDRADHTAPAAAAHNFTYIKIKVSFSWSLLILVSDLQSSSSRLFDGGTQLEGSYASQRHGGFEINQQQIHVCSIVMFIHLMRFHSWFRFNESLLTLQIALVHHQIIKHASALAAFDFLFGVHRVAPPAGAFVSKCGIIAVCVKRSLDLFVVNCH